MKRDLDLIRHILITIEESDSARFIAENFENEQFNHRQITYHLSLLDDAGLIVATEIPITGSAYPCLVVNRLSNSGHDFLDSIRDDEIFTKTKKTLLSVAGTSTLEIVKSVAMGFISSKLGL